MKEKGSNSAVPTKNMLERMRDVTSMVPAALFIWETRLERDDDEYFDDAAMSLESLEAWCDGVLGCGPEASECLAKLFAVLMDSLDEGTRVIAVSKATIRVRNTLCEGVELMYRRSEAYRLGFELYTLSVLGHVQPEDEPVAVLTRALKRSVADYAEWKREARNGGKKRKGKTTARVTPERSV